MRTATLRGGLQGLRTRRPQEPGLWFQAVTANGRHFRFVVKPEGFDSDEEARCWAEAYCERVKATFASKSIEGTIPTLRIAKGPMGLSFSRVSGGPEENREFMRTMQAAT